MKAIRGATIVLALIVMPPKRRGLKLISDKRLPFSGWGDIAVEQQSAFHTEKSGQYIKDQHELLSASVNFRLDLMMNLLDEISVKERS